MQKIAQIPTQKAANVKPGFCGNSLYFGRTPFDEIVLHQNWCPYGHEVSVLLFFQIYKDMWGATFLGLNENLMVRVLIRKICPFRILPKF